MRAPARRGIPIAGARERAVVLIFAATFISDLVAVGSSPLQLDVAVGSSPLQLDLLDRLECGAFVSDEDIDANETRQGSIGLLQFALFVAAAIAFIAWLFGAYRNTDVVPPASAATGTAGRSAAGSCRS